MLLFFQRQQGVYAGNQQCDRPGEDGCYLQQVVGTQYGDRFYPSISGVARSLNYYPIGDEKPKREL